ncbi:MAG: UDP-N-acetylmuramoyl-tripeptide--D-alanyl-D-alanine ligase [Ignavibacteriaceae bacterium]
MNKMNLTIEDLFDVPNSEIFNPDNFKPVSSVLIDSRNKVKNALFVAIKGNKFDGHNFLRAAIKNGAAAVVINRSKYKNFKDIDIPVITVKDTTKALGDIAKIWRNKLSQKSGIKVIAITGSNGKTSTKEMIAELLNEKYSVNKTEGNNNNHIGVPLTIFSTNEKHEILVLELGTNHFGEIEYTSDIAKPDYALITNIGDSHLEFLIDRNGVFKEKAALFRITNEKNGFIFINNDDKILKKSSGNYKNHLTYGFKTQEGKDPNTDVEGKYCGYTDDGRPIIEINYKNKKIVQSLPLYGNHNASNYLAAVSIALKLGLSQKEILSGSGKLKAVKKRLNVRKVKDFILVDDTYNANPESMKYALELLSQLKNFKRKIAVLGDMFELGKEGIELHKKLAPYIIKNKITELYTVGKRMKYLSDVINNSKIIKKHFRNRESLKSFLKNLELTNSIILFKGSRGMKMEEFIQAIV